MLLATCDQADFSLQEYNTTLTFPDNTSRSTTEMFAVDYEELSNKKVTGFAISLTRFPYPFFFDTYLPTELLTLISFIGFVIPVEIVPGRTALLVTIFLMLINISNMVQHRGPVVRTMIVLSFFS